MEPRRDTITFHRPPPPHDLTHIGASARCASVIWPAPGSSLELWRMRLDLPGVEVALWAHLGATFTPEISQQLRQLVHSTFLGSRYWLIVKALLLKARGDCCEVCESPGPLDAHHLTYAHLGEEIWHLDDLQLLCSLCHGHRHDTVEAVEPEEPAR